MESLDSREAVLELVLELLDEDEFRDGPSAGLVLQAYLRDSPDQLAQVARWARGTARAPPLTVRLVKGAYWDHELVQARQHGWAVPVFEDKAECDRNFETLTRGLLDARPHVRVAIASHNLRSVAHAIACQPRHRRRRRATSSCRCCAGSATNSQHALAARASACAPTARWATSWPGWPTSSAGCSRTRSNELVPVRAGAGHARRGAPGRPVDLRRRAEANVLSRCLSRSPTSRCWRCGAPVRAGLRDALAQLDGELPLAVPVRIGGETRSGDGLLSTDPGAPERVVARAAAATAADVDAAVGPAQRGLAPMASCERRRARPGAAGGGGVDARAAPAAGRAGGPRVRQAVAGGRRRRVRGDRLPGVLRPRGCRAGRRTRPAPGPGRAQRDAPTRRAASSASSPRGTSRWRSPAG